MLRWTRHAALCLLLVLPSALAGTAVSPDVTDAAGDAPGPLDVTSMWITSDAASVTFHLKVANLTGPDPLLGGEGARYYYRVEFQSSTSGRAWYVQGQICALDTASRGVAVAPPSQVYERPVTGVDSSDGGVNGVGACAGSTALDAENLTGAPVSSSVQTPNSTAASIGVDPAAGIVTLRMERQENYVLLTDTGSPTHPGALEPKSTEVGLGAGTVLRHVVVETFLGKGPLVDQGHTGPLDGGSKDLADVAGPGPDFPLD